MGPCQPGRAAGSSSGFLASAQAGSSCCSHVGSDPARGAAPLLSPASCRHAQLCSIHHISFASSDLRVSRKGDMPWVAAWAGGAGSAWGRGQTCCPRLPSHHGLQGHLQGTAPASASSEQRGQDDLSHLPQPPKTHYVQKNSPGETRKCTALGGQTAAPAKPGKSPRRTGSAEQGAAPASTSTPRQRTPTAGCRCAAKRRPVSTRPPSSSACHGAGRP